MNDEPNWKDILKETLAFAVIILIVVGLIAFSLVYEYKKFMFFWKN